jgi:hypothetical protein
LRTYIYPIVWGLLALLLISCEKKIIEIIPVLQVEQDLSIPDAGDIKYFAFPTADIGYAADENSIYKTTNGGQTWSKLTVGNGSTCIGLEFFDTERGMCLIGDLVYVTANGGASWTIKTSGDFIGQTTDGIGVTGSCNYYSCTLQVTTNKGTSFQQAGTCPLSGDPVMAKVAGTKLYLAGSMEHDELFGRDISTGENLHLYLQGVTAYDEPSDIFQNESLSIIVGNRGQILEGYDRHKRTYYGHKYQYYSVDGYHNMAVAVGQRTISVNHSFNGEDKWSELLDTEGNSFKQTFYKIKFIDQTSFYISGENGLLWKARL